MEANYKKDFIKSFFLRVALNVIFLIALHVAMTDTLSILTSYKTNISASQGVELQEGALLSTASYIFDETSILVTQAGLMVVALMALIFGLDHFKIKQGEAYGRFRKRLLLYTIAHLFSCLVMSVYLMCSVGMLIYPQSLRLNGDNAFIWIYPSYAIMTVIYLVDLYKFYTEND